MTNYTENILEAPGNEYVCYCSKITKQQIMKAISNGDRTLATIKKSTGACKGAQCTKLNPRKRWCSV